MSLLFRVVPSLLLIAGGCRALTAEEAAAPQPGAPAGKAAPAGQADPPAPAQSDTITVTGVAGAGYAASGAQTATRTDTPIAETPLSVQSVSSQVVRDQGDLRLKDVIRNVSGVAPSKTEQNGIQFETAYIRGFSQLTYVDGVQFYTLPPVDLLGVKQVDVLKGPASSLYGGMEPGGVINIVPKTPESTARSAVSLEEGRYDLHRGEAESTGPLSKDVAYGVEAAFQDGNSFRDFLHQKSEFFAPSLTWAVSDQTRITTWLWYQHQERPLDNGVQFTFKGAPIGPISQNLAGPNSNNTQVLDDVVYNAQIEHAVSDDLKLRGKFLAHYFDARMDAIRLNNVLANNTVTPFYDNSGFNDKQYDFVGDAEYRLTTGAVRHDFLVGTQLDRNNYHFDFLRDSTLPAISLANPVYPDGPFHPVGGFAEQHTKVDDAAGYAQDQLSALGDTLHILVGGRVDNVNQSQVSFNNGRYFEQSDVGYSGRAGVLYDATAWLSPYANLARSFNPATVGGQGTFSGDTLNPTTGVQYEGGLKFSAFDKKVQLTTAVYQITKDNVAVADPAHTGFSLNGGKLRSRGFEADLSGELAPGLQVIASYAYTDTKVITSTALPVGASFINIPNNSGSAWVSYTVQSGALRHLGAGVGLFAADRRPADNGNTFFLPGYARVDVGAWYGFVMQSGAQVKLQLNVENALDATYYESSTGAGSIEPGSPVAMIGKVSVLF